MMRQLGLVDFWDARLCSSTRGSKGLLEDGAGELFARALTWFVGEG